MSVNVSFLLWNSLSDSTGTTRYPVVSASGGTSKISSEVRQVTPPSRLVNSARGLWQLSARPAHNRDETYLWIGRSLKIRRRSLSHPSILQRSMIDRRRWLYSLFIAIDANFRLRLKTRGISDPELGSGLAYFVNAGKFEAHLKNHINEGDVSIFYFYVRRNAHTSRDRDVWNRVPCSEPGKPEAIKRLHRVGCWCGGLPTWSHSQKRRR